MDNSSVNRAAMSAGVWFATAWALNMVGGGSIPVSDLAMDSAIMGGSALAADYAHGVLGWQPTGMTSAVATGAMYAAAQKAVRGDSNYAVNAGMAAANDFLVEYVNGAWYGA